ncbi:hypothetical protein [Anaeromonas frigoriresistens]|nr:hypothetical protein [Anaeromonas frigoriresistens]
MRKIIKTNNITLHKFNSYDISDIFIRQAEYMKQNQLRRSCVDKS